LLIDRTQRIGMKQVLVRLLLLSSFITAFFMVADGQTIRRVPADYPTIQSAINAALHRDVIIVAPGTYNENINFLGKEIRVMSESGPEVTIIRGDGTDSVVRFVSGEPVQSQINGFTITNGYAGSAAGNEGGGVKVENASGSITNNIITGNAACAAGAGIGIGFGSPVIQFNVITNNTQRNCGGGTGGGISLRGGYAAIAENVITNNSFSTGGGIGIFGGNGALIRGNTIKGNTASTGGGIFIGNFTPALITQNLIVENQALQTGGGIYWTNPPQSVVNNTIANNDAFEGSGIYSGGSFGPPYIANNIIVGKPGQAAYFCGQFFNPDVPPTFRYNNVYSPGGMAYGGTCPDKTGVDGNISADPLFVNPSAGDYHLRAGSPSIDAGDNSAFNVPDKDFDGKPRILDGNGDGVAVVDQGAYEFAALTFPVDLCIQDEATGIVIRINTTTGQYELVACSGLTLSGTGSIISKGSYTTLQDYSSDRRVVIRIDGTQNTATASVQLFSPRKTLSIIDRNILNNNCSCQ
jgi:hypothetical protein